MTLNISSIFGWKKIQKIVTSKFEVTTNPIAKNAGPAVSILAAYDMLFEASSVGAELNIERTMGALLLKRTQALQ
jgi:hypothetical protein